MANSIPTDQPEDIRPIGPGANVDTRGESPAALLEGIDDYSFVEVHNPLSVTFIAQVATTVPANAPMRVMSSPEMPGITQSEGDLRQNYGLSLRNPDNAKGKRHDIQQLPIQAGQTRRMLGGEAQVVVRQLTNAILQREGNGRWLADPHKRREVEERIILRKGSVMEAMGRAPLDVQAQLRQALDGMPTGSDMITEEPTRDTNEFADASPGAGAGSAESIPGQRTLGESGSGNSGRKAKP